MERLKQLSGRMFLAMAVLMMAVCFSGSVCIVVSPDIISFFETVMTSVVRQLVTLAAIFGIMWAALNTPAILRQLE